MKAIAMVTMLFLPAATVGVRSRYIKFPRASTNQSQGVCGSQFFNFDSETHRVKVSTDFAKFWAVTAPLTLIVFVIYWVWRWTWREKQSVGSKSFPNI